MVIYKLRSDKNKNSEIKKRGKWLSKEKGWKENRRHKRNGHGYKKEIMKEETKEKKRKFLCLSQL